MSSTSMRSRLKELSGPRVQVQDVRRVRSGSSGRFLLKSGRKRVNVPRAAMALAERHVRLDDALSAMERLLERGELVVELPVVESTEALIADLEACNITAKAYGAPAKVDVRAIRAKTGLSQDDFALQYGLELATLRNWEQGRSEPDTAARNFLMTIAKEPDAVRGALVR
jgi:DNA-binding transcriptional regulator YiaG